MVKTVVSIELPVDEKLYIKKNTLSSVGEGSGNFAGGGIETSGSSSASAGDVARDGIETSPGSPTSASSPTSAGLKKISIVTGIHGDELEGQLVCYEIQKRIKENFQLLNGTVDIYPALNPLGLDSRSRAIPAFDIDMNETFPGISDGTMVEYVSSTIMEDLKDSDFVIDIHASDILVRELAQVRIPVEFKDKLLDDCKLLNLDMIWVYNSSSVQENSLTYAINKNGGKACAVDMGRAMTYSKENCDKLTDGIFVLMHKLGIWKGEVFTPKEPLCAQTSDDIEIINSKVAGMFVRKVKCGEYVKAGQVIGEVIDPLEGVVKEQITSAQSGIVFTIREYPVVEVGSLLGRIFK